MSNLIKRGIHPTLIARFKEPRQFIQVLLGPRQVGKTILAQQLSQELPAPIHYSTAEEPTLQDHVWIQEQWEAARAKVRSGKGSGEGILILDELQKIAGWSETVKGLWDEDTRNQFPLKVLILGSAQLLAQKGLTESLAGRFEVLQATHWSFAEMREAFGFDLDQYIYFGGYPGAAPLISDEQRWRRYIIDSLIETTISRDILLMTRIDKPALLRRLFQLGCQYSGQVLSYQKMIGQLQDAGEKIRQCASSPKFISMNTALISALLNTAFEKTKEDRKAWGRLVESAIGAHLVNNVKGTNIDLFYWAGHNQEVDFVLKRGTNIVPIEVKSGRTKTNLPGMKYFCNTFKVKRPLLISEKGIPIQDFLLTPITEWVKD